jgi:CsoR family transcriptional regulator, copper-sensing transcriptional repressor
MGGVMKEHIHIEDVISRLSKIEGHVRGIKKMLEEGKPCDEVLIQFSAVKAALSKASKILLEDHFDHCVMGKVTDKDLEKELIEFKKALDKFIN